jgi:hypothetical protein
MPSSERTELDLIDLSESSGNRRTAFCRQHRDSDRDTSAVGRLLAPERIATNPRGKEIQKVNSEPENFAGTLSRVGFLALHNVRNGLSLEGLHGPRGTSLEGLDPFVSDSTIDRDLGELAHKLSRDGSIASIAVLEGYIVESGQVRLTGERPEYPWDQDFVEGNGRLVLVAWNIHSFNEAHTLPAPYDLPGPHTDEVEVSSHLAIQSATVLETGLPDTGYYL